jgi:predicted AlkP superfamily pyrophosphatase or phosphodiesterase
MRRFAILLAFALAAFAQRPARERMVVVISIDGFSASALDDPYLPLPTLRRLVREGARAQAMISVNPTVTWPNHTSMVTGVDGRKHGLLFNGVPVRRDREPVRIEPWIDKAEMVLAPTVYDLAHEAGLTTAQVDWVAVHNAKTITWAFPEVPPVDGPIVREMITAGLVAQNDIAEFRKKPITWRDDIWLQAAIHILTKHRPNLMLFHLLNTDSAQHTYGPGTLAGNTALAYADSRVQQLHAALRANGLLDRVTFIIVSDHGFRAVKRTIRINAMLRSRGLIRDENGKIVCDAWAVPEGGTAMVYVTNSSRRSEIAGQLQPLLAALEGVDRVLAPADFPQYGYPDPATSARMSDLVVSAKDGYGFSGADQGDVVVNVPGPFPSGSHGFLNTDPMMRALFIASGASIRRGVKLGIIPNLDVAPTIAALLGLEMKQIDGKVLREILEAR